MHDFDAFERRFAAALRSDADMSVAAFDPAMVARAAVAGRRRSSTGHSLGQALAPRRFTLNLAPAWLALGLLLVIIVGAIAVGSGLLRLTSVAPTDTASSLPVAEVSPTPAAGAPSAGPDTAVPPTAGMINDVRAILLATDTVGWISTPTAIYRTRDMGSTWTPVQPATWSTIAIVQFVDADTMYATGGYVDPAGGPLTLAATHDGGGSWVEATIDTPAGMANMGLSFRTPANGFATFFSQDGKDVRVFETSDGGRTWAGPVRSSAPRMLYLLKDLTGDPATGNHALVLTNALAPGRPFDNNVYFSLDGGVTWTTREFPVSPIARAAKMKGASLWADDSGRIVLAMDVEGDEQVYTSDDNGQTWEFIRDLGRGVGYVHLLSATEWVFASGSQVVSTLDGGASWRTTDGASRIFPYAYSFASPDHGWSLLSCFYYPAEGYTTYCPEPVPGVNDTTVVFLATTDGGRTWARIGGSEGTR